MLRPSNVPVGGRNFGLLAVECRCLMLELRDQWLECELRRRTFGAWMFMTGLSLGGYGAFRGTRRD